MAGTRQFERFLLNEMAAAETDTDHAIFAVGLFLLEEFHKTLTPPLKAATAKVHVPITKPVKADIVRLRKDGLTQHEIARSLGLNQGRVSEVLRGTR